MKKVAQNIKNIPRRPSAPLGAHLGYKTYLETLSGMIFRGLSFGDPLGFLWGALFDTFLLLGGPGRKWMPF